MKSENFWIAISWRPRLRSQQQTAGNASDPCGTAIANSTNHISPENPGSEFCQHKYAHDDRARNGNGIYRPAGGHHPLSTFGDTDLADRLHRCMTARQQRHYGDGWPYSCRSAACFWCRRAMIRGWWEGMRYWSEAATTSSLAIISIRSPAGLPDAATLAPSRSERCPRPNGAAL